VLAPAQNLAASLSMFKPYEITFSLLTCNYFALELLSEQNVSKCLDVNPISKLKLCLLLQSEQSPSTSNGARTAVRSKRSQPLYVSNSDEEGDIQEQRSLEMKTKPNQSFYFANL